ncbi:unnamed protein product [Gongylonema pulchrum]|uniref:CUB domain-containing protein n=1 Tax=Gongylonema pulchrum TaxID=637853 RepID=A0A183DMA7_9BILA|nr:unnamed protein product [Gongylonema pulchrum]
MVQLFLTLEHFSIYLLDQDTSYLGEGTTYHKIPCTTRDSLIGMRFESDSDWLLIELRTNPWSERPHRGPRIKYRLVDAPYQRC